LFKYVFHSGRNKVFVANVSKISTFNENVLDSKSRAVLRGGGLVHTAASDVVRIIGVLLMPELSLDKHATAISAK